MRNKNTMDTLEYFLSGIFWNLTVLWFYRQVLFAVVPGLNYSRSLMLLKALVALNVSTGFLLTFRRRRNDVSILVSIGFGFGTYFILSFWPTDWVMISWVLGIAMVLAVLYAVLVVLSYVQDRKAKRTKASVWKCAYGCFMGARSIVAMGLLLLVVGTCAGLANVGGYSMPVFSDSQEDSNLTFADNMDTVLLLQEEKWVDLTVNQRLDVLRICADIKCDDMGMEPVNVVAKTTDEHTLGHYEDHTRTVTVSLDHLAYGDVREVLDTLFHEIHHAYAHRLAEVYGTLDEQSRKLVLFRDAAGYADGFANYIDADEDLKGYLYQKVEVDANMFAGHAVAAVYDLIYMHNRQNGFPEPVG